MAAPSAKLKGQVDADEGPPTSPAPPAVADPKGPDSVEVPVSAAPKASVLVVARAGAKPNGLFNSDDDEGSPTAPPAPGRVERTAALFQCNDSDGATPASQPAHAVVVPSKPMAPDAAGSGIKFGSGLGPVGIGGLFCGGSAGTARAPGGMRYAAAGAGAWRAKGLLDVLRPCAKLPLNNSNSFCA